jgi:hypothetical protein
MGASKTSFLKQTGPRGVCRTSLSLTLLSQNLHTMFTLSAAASAQRRPTRLSERGVYTLISKGPVRKEASISLQVVPQFLDSS